MRLLVRTEAEVPGAEFVLLVGSDQADEGLSEVVVDRATADRLRWSFVKVQTVTEDLCDIVWKIGPTNYMSKRPSSEGAADA